MVLWDVNDVIHIDINKLKEEIKKVDLPKIPSTNNPQRIKQNVIDPMDEECMRA